MAEMRGVSCCFSKAKRGRSKVIALLCKKLHEDCICIIFNRTIVKVNGALLEVDMPLSIVPSTLFESLGCSPLLKKRQQ